MTASGHHAKFAELMPWVCFGTIRAVRLQLSKRPFGSTQRPFPQLLMHFRAGAGPNVQLVPHPWSQVARMARCIRRKSGNPGGPPTDYREEFIESVQTFCADGYSLTVHCCIISAPVITRRTFTRTLH
jgi:hypothetical protein